MVDKDALVTIVTVTYNADAYLAQTLQSVIEQSYSNIEHIIVDGASTDGTLSIVRQYESHISHWLSEPDRGIYHAMNKAIGLANGTWINFMNAGDTFVDSTVVERFINKVKVGTDVAYGDHIFCDGDLTELRQGKLSDIYSDIIFNHQSMFYRLNILREYLFDESFSIVADCELHLRAYTDKKTFQYLNFPVANFLGGGVNNTYRMHTIIEFLHALTKNSPKELDIRDSNIFKLLIGENSPVVAVTPASDLECSSGLKHRFEDLCSVSAFRAPLKKLKYYRELLRYYRNKTTSQR